MKMVIREPNRWGSNALVPIQLEKVDDEETLVISHGVTNDEIFRVRAERHTKRLLIEVSESKSAELTGAGLTAKAAVPAAIRGERNWTVKNGKFIVANRASGKVVELDIATGGTHVPGPQHEIYGQDEMVFALALAIHKGMHSMLQGPTGIGKTMVYKWLAHMLGYNFVRMSISRGTEDRHLLGEYLPVGKGEFAWTDGRVTEAARLSQKHPTLLILDEVNRIGNVQEFARMYSLLDDDKQLELSERAHDTGVVEVITAGELFIGATANPPDDEGGDYIGVKELDAAFLSRFGIQPELKYPKAAIEANALVRRTGVATADAAKMVQVANKIRSAAEVRFPFGFRELIAWAEILPFYTFEKAAEVAVITKAHPSYRSDMRRLLNVS